MYISVYVHVTFKAWCSIYQGCQPKHRNHKNPTWKCSSSGKCIYTYIHTCVCNIYIYIYNYIYIYIYMINHSCSYSGYIPNLSGFIMVYSPKVIEFATSTAPTMAPSTWPSTWRRISAVPQLRIQQLQRWQWSLGDTQRTPTGSTTKNPRYPRCSALLDTHVVLMNFY